MLAVPWTSITIFDGKFRSSIGLAALLYASARFPKAHVMAFFGRGIPRVRVDGICDDSLTSGSVFEEKYSP
jgi:hypothetical protein